MKIKKLFEIAFYIGFSLSLKNVEGAEIKRLVSTSLDLSKAHVIYMSTGLVTSVKFPYPVTELKIGNPYSLKALISKTLQSEVTLRLTGTNSSPTNLIARCGKKVFVLDIAPSTSIHQDYVKITAGYSDPEYEDRNLALIDSYEKRRSKPTTNLKLIDSSEHYKSVE